VACSFLNCSVNMNRHRTPVGVAIAVGISESTAGLRRRFRFRFRFRPSHLLRFMGSVYNQRLNAHWNHEPCALPLTRPASGTPSPPPRAGEREGVRGHGSWKERSPRGAVCPGRLTGPLFRVFGVFRGPPPEPSKRCLPQIQNARGQKTGGARPAITGLARISHQLLMSSDRSPSQFT